MYHNNTCSSKCIEDSLRYYINKQRNSYKINTMISLYKQGILFLYLYFCIYNYKYILY